MELKLVKEEYTERKVIDFNKYDEVFETFHKITKEQYFSFCVTNTELFRRGTDEYIYKNKNKKSVVKWILCNSYYQDMREIIDEAYFKLAGVPINIELVNKLYKIYLRKEKLKRIVK